MPSSRRRSGPCLTLLPEIYTDTSVGGRQVPQLFRDRGFVVRTKLEVFGQRAVPDTEWIQLAGEQGWLAVCKDDRIRYNVLELEAIRRVDLRVL